MSGIVPCIVLSGVSYQASAILHRAPMLSGVSYRYISLYYWYQASAVGAAILCRVPGAPMRPCAWLLGGVHLHRRRTACAVSRMHVRGGAGAVCRNGINRAAVGVSYEAPVIPPAVGRELVCCWVGLRASAHLARAVMLIHCAAIDLDCIAKGMASIG